VAVDEAEEENEGPAVPQRFKDLSAEAAVVPVADSLAPFHLLPDVLQDLALEVLRLRFQRGMDEEEVVS